MMLTSEREVDEKLRKMNEAFLKSLEGLGRGSGVGRERSREGERARTRSIGSQRERERTSAFYGDGREGESERERTTSLSGRYSTLGYGRFRRGSDTAPSAGAAETGGTGSGLSRARSGHVTTLPSSRSNIPVSHNTTNTAMSTGTNTMSFPPIFRPSSRTGNVYAHGFGSEEVIGKLELDSESGSVGSGSGSGGGSRFGRGAGGRFDF
jgi:autophagy-related protein 13